MHIRYIFYPKNPNLNHCAESFCKAFKVSSIDGSNACVAVINSIDIRTFFYLIRRATNLKSGEVMSIFLFALQFEYLVLTLILNIICSIFSKNCRIYYLMHEPKYNKGESKIHPIKEYLIHLYNVCLGYSSYKILVPSEEAFIRAKTFIDPQKISKINLPFSSISEQTLKNNLAQLKSSWGNNKTFSFIGTVVKDKNPKGFIELVNICYKNYPDKATFIRAGRDKDICVTYDETLIVRFPGYISNNAKKFILALTHFVVIPYSLSTQSGVISESLSYGKLLIINDIPSFSYLKNQEFVFFVDFNDEESILECIHKLFNMELIDYEKLYWQAVKYFHENHSESYLLNTLSNVL